MEKKVWLLLKAASALLSLHIVLATNSSEHEATNGTLAASDIFTSRRTMETHNTRFATVTIYRRSSLAKGIVASIILGALAAAVIVVLSLMCCCRRECLRDPNTTTAAVVYHAPVPPQAAGVAMQTMPLGGHYSYPPPLDWPPPAYEDPYVRKDGRGTFDPRMASSAGLATSAPMPPPYTIHGTHVH